MMFIAIILKFFLPPMSIPMTRINDRAAEQASATEMCSSMCVLDISASLHLTLP